jgi:CxxC motif-containing protein
MSYKKGFAIMSINEHTAIANQTQRPQVQSAVQHFPQDITCICCPIGCSLHIEKSAAGEFMITGNKCARGKKYAVEEMTAPQRIVTSTVKVSGGVYPVISVKTAAAVPKEKIFAVMDVLSDVDVSAPIRVGDVVVPNVAGTGVDIVATKNS